MYNQNPPWSFHRRTRPSSRLSVSQFFSLVFLFLVFLTVDSYSQAVFIRGDVDASGAVDQADIDMYSNYLYSGGTITCMLAADVNDDGISPSLPDLAYLISYLNSLGPVPPAPFPDCGPDPTSPQAGTSCCVVNPIFQPRVNYNVGTNPYAVCAIDFDGDGDIDLVSSNTASDNISVLRNNGNGIFASAEDIATGDYTNHTCFGHFDDDAIIDMAVSCAGEEDSIAIYIGDGVGGMAFDAKYYCGNSPTWIHTDDFNNDDNLDLVVADFDPAVISVLLGNGDGTFQSHVDFPIGSQLRCVCPADLDGDLDLDLVVACSGLDSIAIMFNDGLGGFTLEYMFAAGDSPGSMALVDYNHDTFLDIAIVSWYTDDIKVLLGNGDGTFQEAVGYPTGNAATSIFSVDLDGDGEQDLAVANHYSDDVSILTGNGDGTFNPAENYLVGDGPRWVCSADFDGNGSDDIAVTNFYDNNVSVFLNVAGETSCCIGIRGNANADPEDKVIISDVTYLINYLFGIPNGPAPLCPEEGNANGDSEEKVIISDVTYLINYLFGIPPGPEPPPCP